MESLAYYAGIGAWAVLIGLTIAGLLSKKQMGKSSLARMLIFLFVILGLSNGVALFHFYLFLGHIKFNIIDRSISGISDHIERNNTLFHYEVGMVMISIAITIIALVVILNRFEHRSGTNESV